jgi:hypothetical protein
MELGRRIVVYGVTGSGKTTLARRLGDALGLHVLQLDAIRHAHGWDSTPWDEMRAQAIDWLEAHADGWVCEGNYREVRETILARADTAIWLHLPWRVSFTRLLRRTVHRAWTKEPLYGPGSPSESFRVSFLDPKSILWWAIHHHGKTTRAIGEVLRRESGRLRVHELRRPADVDALLNAARRASPSARPRRVPG